MYFINTYFAIIDNYSDAQLHAFALRKGGTAALNFCVYFKWIFDILPAAIFDIRVYI